MKIKIITLVYAFFLTTVAVQAQSETQTYTIGNCTVEMPLTKTQEGENEYFEMKDISCEVVAVDIKVFNRWGNQVYTSRDPQFSWDGTFEGKNLPDGSYFWVLTLKLDDNGEIIKNRVEGYLQILR